MSDSPARNVTHDVCSHCGKVAGMGAHGHPDAPDWRWRRVDYVPAEELWEVVMTWLEYDAALVRFERIARGLSVEGDGNGYV